MEVSEARGNFETLNERLNNSDNKKADKTEVSNLESQIKSLASGSPLVANSIDEMTDTSKVYVNTTDGHWYTYNGTIWVDGGVYQSTEIADNSIYKSMLNDDILKSFCLINLYNYMTTKTGGVENSGYFNSNISNLKTSDYIKVIPGEKYVVLQIDGNVLIRFSNYNSNKEFINMSVYQNNQIVTIPEDVNYVNIGVFKQNYLKFIFMKYEEYLKIFKNEYINPFFKIPYENLPTEISNNIINFKNLSNPIRNAIRSNYINNGEIEKIIDTITDNPMCSTSNTIFISTTVIPKNYFIQNIKIKPSSNDNINCKIILFTKEDTNFIVKKIINAPFILNETDEKVFDINYLCDDITYIGFVHPYYHIGAPSSWSVGTYVDGQNIYKIPERTENAVLEMEVDTIDCNISKLNKIITPDMNLNSIANNANDNDIFILMPGKYEASLNVQNKITLIGLDKENTIIYNNSGEYDRQPAFLRNGTYKNITFYAEKSSDTENNGSYATHIDNMATNNKINFENCNFVSDFNCSVGIGTCSNSFINFIRCNFIYQGSNKDLAPLYFHTAEPSISRGDNQHLYFEDCNCINKTGEAAIRVDDRAYTNENLYITFKKCCLYNKQESLNVIKTAIFGNWETIPSGEGWLNLKTVFLKKDSFGNNVKELNA